jgi:hypothetical protein
VLVPLTLSVSRRRRRTLLQLTAALILGTVVVRRLVMALESQALDRVRVPANRSAAEAVTARFVDPLLGTTVALLWILLAVLVVAFLTGSSSGARRLRSTVTRGWAAVTAPVRSPAGGIAASRGAAWIHDHLAVLEAADVAVTFAVLLLFDLTWLGVLVVLLLAGAGALVLRRIATLSAVAAVAAVSTVATDGDDPAMSTPRPTASVPT